MAARVPAWKRLGLKLKGASDDAPAHVPTPSHTPGTGKANQSRAVNGSPASALKRKLPPSQTTYGNNNYAQTPNKRPRGDDQTPNSQRKSVSFSADTKTTSVEQPTTTKKKAKKPKKQPKKQSDAPKPETNLEPSLEYLRQWKSSRSTWRFNKNHQTLLIKYLFADEAKIPSADISAFYEYIRDLKGGVRTRLRETAAAICKTDMDQGTGGFPAATKDKEAKQAQYEEVISRFLRDLSATSSSASSSSSSAAAAAAAGADDGANGKKRPLDEVEYVIRTADPVIKQRLLKRIRAEMVKEELAVGSDSDDTMSTTTATAAETATTTSSSSSSSNATATPAGVADKAPPRKADGSQQPAKRRRLRNLRTDIAGGDESSSSDSSSESESDSDKSDSSEDDNESEDEEVENEAENNDSSSDSDSSTSSESSSDTDSESDSDAEVGVGEAEHETSSSSSSSSSDSDSD